MANLTVRNLSEEVHRVLRMRAARHGRSTEAEARIIIEETVRPPKRLKIGSEIQRIAREVGGMDELDTSLHRSEIRGADFT
jgi:antitoxin FitA